MAKILIVEDNEINLKLFKRIVSSMGHETLTANNGREGIEIAAENLPDMVLMDIKMPVMDGSEAMKVLKAGEKTKKIPVIAVTAYAMKGDRERFLGEGFTDYIAKPVNREEFIKTVKSVLGENNG
ncbi:MAG: response regulator [Candidatus Omnitrophica bacterium]|nr:response regulator [Candidatus Omnitrophota bacterium]